MRPKFNGAEDTNYKDMWTLCAFKKKKKESEQADHTTNKSASTTSSKVAWNASTNYRKFIVLARKIFKNNFKREVTAYLSIPAQANLK